MEESQNIWYRQRAEFLKCLKNRTFDLLVIGGGVTGCGIALDAASRGLDTILIEKEDFASGTSSKSTKLIHGGLRYLKQFEFGLVHETGTERAVVHRLARHLVLPEKMLLPIIEDGSFGKLSTSFGLKVYDILANVKGEDRRKMLNKKQALKKEPLLNPKNLKAAGYYAEYRTDDARLTIELLKTAVRMGAKALNYCEFTNFNKNHNNIDSIICTDKLNNQTYQIRAKHIVSAAGPWVDDIRKKDGALSNKSLHLTKGIHIVFPKTIFPIKQTIYFDVHDGRMIFAVPRGNAVYLGTTDTNYHNSKDHIEVTQEDVLYLLQAANFAFPSLNLTREDIISSWAGLRPLIHEEGKSPSELSRRDEIFESDSGLISIAGGKLTGYRKMAERVVDLVVDRFKNKDKLNSIKSLTKDIFLTESPFDSMQDVTNFTHSLMVLIEKDFSANRANYLARYLTNLYGGMALEIIKYYKKNTHANKEIQLALAEVHYGLENEWVWHLNDFMIRRTGRLYFDIESIPIIKYEILKKMAAHYQWTEDESNNQSRTLENAIFEATQFA